MTQEAAEAQLEADEQIDADFRNLEEKLQGELNDAEQLQQELSEEAKLARELPKEHAMATRLQQFHAQASAAGHTWTGQELQAMLETQQENKSLQMAEVRALQNELRSCSSARTSPKHLKNPNFNRILPNKSKSKCKRRFMLFSTNFVKRGRFMLFSANFEDLCELVHLYAIKGHMTQDARLRDLSKRNPMSAAIKLDVTLCRPKRLKNPNFNRILPNKSKSKCKRRFMLFSTNFVFDDDNDDDDDDDDDHGGCDEDDEDNSSCEDNAFVQTKKKSVERIAEMQSEKQDLLEQIVGLKRLLDDEKQVGKLLASQRMVAARVQATITQEMAELTEQEASQAEHLQRLNFAESTCAEELMDLRFDVELRAASLCRSQVRVARAMRWDANRQKASKSAEEAEVSVPAKIQNELVKLETVLNLWDARTKQALHAGPTKKAPSQDAELHLRAQLARAEMKALRFQGGQEMAEKRIIKLQSELSELEKAMWKDELNEDLGLEKPENEEVQSESEIPSRSMSEALTDVGEIRRHGQGSVHSWRKSWAHVDSLEFQAQQDQQHLQRDGVKLTRAATLSPLTQEAQPRDWRMSWSGV
eukprot:symbB.v1.2.038313.t2/scaffold5926.1/size22390/1